METDRPPCDGSGPQPRSNRLTTPGPAVRQPACGPLASAATPARPRGVGGTMTTDTGGDISSQAMPSPPRRTAVHLVPATPSPVIVELARVFAGRCVWYGHTTGRCWALVADASGRHALLEGLTPRHLAHRLRDLPGWSAVRLPPAPRVVSMVSRPEGTWAPAGPPPAPPRHAAAPPDSPPPCPPRAGQPERAGQRARLRWTPRGWAISGTAPQSA